MPNAWETLAEKRSLEPGSWYYAQYQATADTDLPTADEFDTYPGLVFLRLIDDEEGGFSLGAYWAGKPDFEASRRPLESRTGATLLERSGYLRQLRLPKKPLIKRLPTLLLSLVALLGGLEALQNHYSRLFEHPELSLDLGGPEAYDQLEKTPLAFDLSILNGSPDEVAAARLDSVTITPRQKRAGSEPSYPQHVSIPAGGAIKVTIKNAPLDPGFYLLTVAGRARVGLLRGWVPIDAKRNIEVWPASPHVPMPLRLQRSGPRKGWLSGTVMVGRSASSGLDCEAVLISVPNVRIQVVRGATSWTLPSTGGANGAETVKVRWRFGPLPAYQAKPFQIGITADEASNWETLAAKAQVLCTEHRE